MKRWLKYGLTFGFIGLLISIIDAINSYIYNNDLLKQVLYPLTIGGFPFYSILKIFFAL